MSKKKEEERKNYRKNYLVTVEAAVLAQKGVELMVAPVTGAVVGFKLPDGRIARPILGFEIEGPEGEYTDATAGEMLDILGLEIWDYPVTELKEAP